MQAPLRPYLIKKTGIPQRDTRFFCNALSLYTRCAAVYAAAQKLLDSIKEFIAKVRDLVTGKARDAAAQDAFGTDFGTLEKAAEAWQKAFDAAEKTAEGAKKTATEGGEARYQIKYPKYAESDITENSMALQSMDSVGHFTGKELGDRSVPLDKRVKSFFDSIGNNVYSEQFGDVSLSKTSINSEFGHGMTPLKVVTFAAVPNVIKRGVVIYTLNKNSSGLERIVVAAPVTVGTPAEKMYVAVMLQRDPQSQRLYLHDAVTEKELGTNSTEHLKTHRGSDTANGELYTTDILRNALNVKKKFSLKAYSAEEMKQHAKDAKEFFGKTYNWNETGYITTDGTKLDFSGKHEGGPGGYRAVDHRDIRDALGDNYGGEEYGGSLVQFMSEGNIRISPESGGINLSVLPTKAQFDALSDFVSKNCGEVVVDIDDINGNTLVSTEYPKHTHSSKVVNDIKAYFETGATPHVSELGQFRYQLRGTAEVEQELREAGEHSTILSRSKNRASPSGIPGFSVMHYPFTPAAPQRP